MTNKRIHILVSGLVQGVFFRLNTKNKAKELNLKGWVRNLADGRVEILAEGKKEDLKRLLEWTYNGPPGAKVTKVEFEWLSGENNFNDFVIKYQ